jgi:hypothetical protein
MWGAEVTIVFFLHHWPVQNPCKTPEAATVDEGLRDGLERGRYIMQNNDVSTQCMTGQG